MVCGLICPIVGLTLPLFGGLWVEISGCSSNVGLNLVLSSGLRAKTSTSNFEIFVCVCGLKRGSTKYYKYLCHLKIRRGCVARKFGKRDLLRIKGGRPTRC